MKAVPFLVASLVLSAVGCTSVKSTLINRTETDVFIGNSNGEPKAKCAARPFNGVPITLRVPTHVDIAIKEKILMKSDGQNKLSRLKMDKRHLFVDTEIIETEKVFTVDVKRPAAGTLNYDMTFGENENDQYFSEINSKIVDKTIQDITSALGEVTKAITTSSETSNTDDAISGRDATTKIIPEVRTVAWRRFDLDACDFEEQVAHFVAQHMNNCNSCQTYEAHGVSAKTQETVEDLPQPTADHQTAFGGLISGPDPAPVEWAEVIVQ